MGPRLSGSDNAEKAIQWAFAELKKYSFDRVDTQSVMVPRWERGEKEQAWFYSDVFTGILKENKSKRTESLEKTMHGSQFPSSPHPEWECESYLEQGITPSKRYKIPVVALGGSVSGSVKAGLISVRTRRELDSLGKLGKLKGKIVLLARPMDDLGAYYS